MNSVKNIIAKLLTLPLAFKIISVLLLGAVIWFGYSKTISSQGTKVQYQTSQVQKGTIVSTISASGTVAGGNNTTIYTSASGLVIKVYAKNGDTVRQGQKLADIQLDQDAVQKQTTAWASYLSSQNNAKNTEINKSSLVVAVDSANKSVMDAQNAVNVMNSNITNGTGNPSTHQSYSDLEKNSITSALTVAQQNYAIANQKLAQADAAIATAKTQMSSSWYSYQQTAPTITAPATGVLSNFALIQGISLGNLSSNTASNSNTNATQSVGIIANSNNTVTASVSLTEIDVVKAQPGQKVTLTLDAFPDKTFTGKILAINTNGQVSSGVTTYPTVIIFDEGAPNMYPNMAVTAKIITQVKNDALYVPSNAIQTTNGATTARVLKDNQLTYVPIETGISDDANTEITSGLSEGDNVVTSVTGGTTSKSTSSTTSPFSSLGGNRGFGAAGGNQVRIMTR